MKDRKEYFNQISDELVIKFYSSIYFSSLSYNEFISNLVQKKLKTIQIDKGETLELWSMNLENRLYDELFKITNKVLTKFN